MKLHAPAFPIDPTTRPLYTAPNACAQSSISGSPCSSATAFSSSIRAGFPIICTTMIAFVCGVIFARTSSASRLNVRSISASTGIPRAYTIDEMLAINVNPGTITSSPGPIPSPASAVNNADVPEFTATPYFTPTYSATACSLWYTFRLNRGSTSSPSDTPYRNRYPPLSTSNTSWISSSPMYSIPGPGISTRSSSYDHNLMADLMTVANHRDA